MTEAVGFETDEETGLEFHKEPIKWDNFSGDDEEDDDGGFDGEEEINWKQQPPFFFQRLDSDEVSIVFYIYHFIEVCTEFEN